MRSAFLLTTLLSVLFIANSKCRPAVNDAPSSNVVPSGKAMYKQHCADCHGVEAKGDGPYAPMLKVLPPNLTTLAKRHDGKFPYDYVTNILRFGPRPTILHGSPDMPAWGRIFYVDKNNVGAVEQRIKNLCDYLALLQEK
jgi:mono/diheme cytochrome c family protein